MSLAPLVPRLYSKSDVGNLSHLIASAHPVHTGGKGMICYKIMEDILRPTTRVSTTWTKSGIGQGFVRVVGLTL